MIVFVTLQTIGCQNGAQGITKRKKKISYQSEKKYWVPYKKQAVFTKKIWMFNNGLFKLKT